MSFRFAKIVGTLGPSCSDENTIRQLINAGLDVARLNFSHGTHDEHAQRIKILRNLSEELGKPITILMDLQGPKLRIGKLPIDGIELSAGEDVVLSSSDSSSINFGEATHIPFEIPELDKALSPGSHILLDDGNLEFEVTAINGLRIDAKVVLGGTLFSHKGVNLPGALLEIPVLTTKDLADLEFGLSLGVDAVAISFVKDHKDILTVRDTIAKFASGDAQHTPIIAKLERPEALQNLERIMEVTDGVMVARGDLGVELSPSLVPVAQKEIIKSANQHAKIVITATQMLDSMINNPRPTRAEAADIANAIFDGTDAVMLSGETAAGKYPVESVLMMDSIVREAEKHISEWGHLDAFVQDSKSDDAISITRAAKELAQDRDVAAIVVFTQSGRTAQWMSKTKPNVPIIAFTPIERTYHLLGLMWGVTPLLVPHADTLETMITHVETALASSTSLKAGQQVVLISGFPVGEFRKPNLALLYTLKG
ncbi:MAG: pyruvate kinase [Anaerolineaceae bacterium]|nr:pyruvate kinase [Anaerolineaceae bacterium]